MVDDDEDEDVLLELDVVLTVDAVLLLLELELDELLVVLLVELVLTVDAVELDELLVELVVLVVVVGSESEPSGPSASSRSSIYSRTRGCTPGLFRTSLRRSFICRICLFVKDILPPANG